jgi:putative redox protein
MTEEQRTRLFAAVERCPIHKLMTTTEVRIETAPLAKSPSAIPH